MAELRLLLTHGRRGENSEQFHKPGNWFTIEVSVMETAGINSFSLGLTKKKKISCSDFKLVHLPNVLILTKLQA